jgi:hypothetical protein
MLKMGESRTDNPETQLTLGTRHQDEHNKYNTTEKLTRYDDQRESYQQNGVHQKQFKFRAHDVFVE